MKEKGFRDFAICGVCVPRETASNEKRSIFEMNVFFFSSLSLFFPSLDFILMTRSRISSDFIGVSMRRFDVSGA